MTLFSAEAKAALLWRASEGTRQIQCTKITSCDIMPIIQGNEKLGATVDAIATKYQHTAEMEGNSHWAVLSAWLIPPPYSCSRRPHTISPGEKCSNWWPPNMKISHFPRSLSLEHISGHQVRYLQSASSKNPDSSQEDSTESLAFSIKFILALHYISCIIFIV